LLYGAGEEDTGMGKGGRYRCEFAGGGEGVDLANGSDVPECSEYEGL